MNTSIYIIFGASGSGKTTLLNIIQNNYNNIDIHKKATTRKKGCMTGKK